MHTCFFYMGVLPLWTYTRTGKLSQLFNFNFDYNHIEMYEKGWGDLRKKNSFVGEV